MDKHIEFLAGAVEEILTQRNHLQTLHQILYRLKAVMPVSAAALVLSDPVTEDLSVVCQNNISRTSATALKEIVKPAVISRIFYRDRFIVVSTDDEMSDFKELRLDEVYHEAVLIRVSDQNRAIGFIIIFFKEIIEIDSVTHNFLTTFAGLLSLALEKRERKEESPVPALVCSKTSLLTYSSFFKHLEKEVERASSLDLSLSLTLMDIGNYRHVLSTYGLETARQLCCEVARDIRETLRKVDMAGIYGADEFIAYLPEISKEEAETVCRRCAERVAGSVYTDHKLASSLIIGVAHHAKGESSGDLLFKMQKAFYQARVSENRLHCWDA